ncbi:hypothetical protein LOZ12_002069 [Ophidiomyces ophidiicola]|uniref:Uncharacterized protein n=1 Tax=Ophidiomyces ophidiicola TaxID=1387563 RepID=A0ACB8UYH4_9EURO|nr:hypothetical protein LOZ61_002501 [Ophidiomyces ophidiicola]KAI1916751.1 hypothetical protein LOZ64_003210 [Ophidiomyces ophidiicola]KAI1947972.1 hypothetical protein LOZ62_002830 [Ophidiomyces ophidiicola]KAI1961590.1 hypothetical protein LOZ59_002392 [Ophidiomyces ophidiicola]KAI1974178.1 hypothetical protein LOZ56_001379 [Ophidiomyces ophidiicola]
MNPYEANPNKIPENDRFADVPLYGRYYPRPDDFRPDPQYINSTSPESLQYWEGVLKMCDKTVRIFENQNGGRDVFALGSVIIKSCHLNSRGCRDYSLADQNEVKAIGLVRGTTDIRLPEIFFADKIRHWDVLVQSRIPGVGLNVAWQYLTTAEKHSFKSQARGFLRQISSLPSPFSGPSYILPDPDPITHRGIRKLEASLLFGGTGNLELMHNDLTPSNIIVDDGRIVGVVDWEMAGYFGWQRAADVHVSIRMPKRENFAQLDLEEDFLQDILFWNDLYAIDGPSSGKSDEKLVVSVSKYIVSQGILILEHIQSIESPSKNAFHSPKTTIDVKPNLLLGALKHTDIDVGNWINVIGYVRQQPPVPKENSRKRTNEDAQVYIEAVMIIPAGPIRIGEYEKIVAESRDVNRRLKMPNNNGPG